MKKSKDQGRKKRKNPQGFLYKTKHEWNENEKNVMDYSTVAKKQEKN